MGVVCNHIPNIRWHTKPQAAAVPDRNGKL